MAYGGVTGVAMGRGVRSRMCQLVDSVRDGIFVRGLWYGVVWHK